MIYSIGNYAFDDMRGTPPVMSQQIEILERLGVEGTGFRQKGVRSRQGKITTHAFHTSFSTAKANFAAYLRDLVGASDPQMITQHSITKGYYIIERVDEVELRACESVIGSIIQNPKAYQVCEWTIWQTST